MSLSRLPLSYCTNVHPGRSLDEVLAGLARFTLGIRERYGQPLAAGLWLAQPVIRELDDAGRLAHLRDWLTQHNLPCYTLNAFPYGDFHSDRVKEQVYLPDWTSPARRDYTLACARVSSAKTGGPGIAMSVMATSWPGTPTLSQRKSPSSGSVTSSRSSMPSFSV